jgi:hypothetical protein
LWNARGADKNPELCSDIVALSGNTGVGDASAMNIKGAVSDTQSLGKGRDCCETSKFRLTGDNS